MRTAEHHLLSGRRPRAAAKAGRLVRDEHGDRQIALSHMAPRLPVDLMTIVEKAMAPSPGDRYPTAGDMAADLRRNTSLVGPVGSAGLWQFERRNARERGLRVDETVDERLDVTKSTHIAAQCEQFAEPGDDATLMAVLAYPLGAGKSAGSCGIAMEKGVAKRAQR